MKIKRTIKKNKKYRAPTIIISHLGVPIIFSPTVLEAIWKEVSLLYLAFKG